MAESVVANDEIGVRISVSAPNCSYGVMVACEPSKLWVRVRVPLAAPVLCRKNCQGMTKYVNSDEIKLDVKRRFDEAAKLLKHEVWSSMEDAINEAFKLGFESGKRVSQWSEDDE